MDSIVTVGTTINAFLVFVIDYMAFFFENNEEPETNNFIVLVVKSCRDNEQRYQRQFLCSKSLLQFMQNPYKLKM